MRVPGPAKAEEALSREGVDPSALRRGTTHGGLLTKKVVAVVLIIFLLLALITGFFVLL